MDAADFDTQWSQMGCQPSEQVLQLNYASKQAAIQ
jgi:hypothetical protein